MRAGETWVYVFKTDYPDASYKKYNDGAYGNLKIRLVKKIQDKDCWKCVNLTPEYSICFSADITPETPHGYWDESCLPSFIIREFFAKEYNNEGG